jgi:hypothetical protein
VDVLPRRSVHTILTPTHSLPLLIFMCFCTKRAKREMADIQINIIVKLKHMDYFGTDSAHVIFRCRPACPQILM